MAIQMRPGYVNPLAMKKAVPKLGQPTTQPAAKQGKQTDKVTELQTKQQQLQNQMLLLKATGTDSAGATAETQKIVAEELEKVTAELRSAKGSGVQAMEQAGQARLDTQPTAARPNKDLYQPENADTAFPGIYQVEKDEEQHYKISFLPYSED